MKTTGGRDTFLLFVVLILAIGAVCYLFVIKKSLNKLNEAEAELAVVEQEKAEKDKIIAQAEELNQVREELKKSLGDIEGKLLPDLYTHAIQRKLYKHFEDAGIPYLVESSDDAKKYETVTLPDGTSSPNRVMYSSYTIKVSGTDGWLLTHDEKLEGSDKTMDQLPYQVFYEQAVLEDNGNTTSGDANATTTQANKSAAAEGITEDLRKVSSKVYVGYEEFIAAIQKIQADAPEYVKIVDIGFEDQGQGFGYYTAVVNVYAFDLVDRISTAKTDMNYMKWVGADNIATGGLVGLPNYFLVKTNNPNYTVDPSSPLYNHYVSMIDFNFAINRPFAAWNMWSYEWQTLKATIDTGIQTSPEELDLDLQLKLGMIDMATYNQQKSQIVGSGVEMGTTTTENTPAT